MCSISGFINLSEKASRETILEKMGKIIIAGEERGRDSFGVFIHSNGGEEIFKKIGKPSDYLKEFFNKKTVNYAPFVILNNNRAEPTTEYIENKTEKDTQPFKGGSVVCVHNGIIANDKELKQRYNIKTETTIDSEVLPHLISMCRTDQELADMLTEQVKGSYALAAYNLDNNRFYLATNYKPLYIMKDKNGDMYFSSMPSYLNENYKQKYDSDLAIEVKPYTLISLDRDEGFESMKHYSLYPKQQNHPKKALIIASSGLDSTVAASWAQNQGYDVTLLHFHYDAIAQEKEKQQIKLIAERIKAPLHFIPIDFYKNIIGGSNLYSGGEINKSNDGESGTELAFEWVPARNLVFFSIATAFAEAHNMDYIILGGNLEESGAYPDNEQIFQQKFNDLLPNAIAYNKKIAVLAPLATLMKKEIVELGMKVNAPLDLTWSCYDDGDLHCGQCGPCYMRKTAFKMAGIKEVINYKND